MSESTEDISRQAIIWERQRQRLGLECRECEVICERVVYPWQCLRSNCKYVYAFADEETKYFGCLHKVFTPELDLAAFSGLERHAPDPYGMLKTARSPRPECRVTVEKAYACSFSERGCCNPAFFQHPSAPPDSRIRLRSNISPDPDPDELA